MDYDTLMRRVWSNGSYGRRAPDFLSMAARLVERAGVGAGDRVLDVGCGTGNVAVTAARRGAAVTGVDITPSMLDRARDNAALAGVEDAEFREGDATDLPLPDDAFDVTLSAVGHMYADPPEAAARELVRVTRPGGRIAFTSWTPTSVFPFLSGVAATYLAPEDMPDFSEPPFMWGDSDVVAERLDGDVVELDFETHTISVPALSLAGFWRTTEAYSGIFGELVDLIDEADRPALREELIESIEPYFDDDTNAVEMDYLLTTAIVD